MTEEELAILAERARAWAASEEGRRQMRESVEAAERTIAELTEARRIPWCRLHEPMI